MRPGVGRHPVPGYRARPWRPVPGSPTVRPGRRRWTRRRLGGGVMEGDSLTVERVIAAPPEAIFRLLADAGSHARIDGSGTLKGAKEPSQQLTLGSRFGMSMRQGVPYSVVNEVVEFEDNRRIAWRPTAAGFLSKIPGP